MEGRPEESSSVGVAVRVRPLNAKEKLESPSICISVNDKEKIITIGGNRNFTFDQVFNMESKQEDLFNGCAKDLVSRVFKGYNATILAYGQTGSGKTFTMGSGQLVNMKEEDIGIIPRVITMIFDERDNRKAEADFVVKINFIELYNEEIHDLLNNNAIAPNKNFVIREKEGSICIDGICEEEVTSAEETFKCLENGTLQRKVSETNMNSQSSRSHAIFTINVMREPLKEENTSEKVEVERWTAKFHFVDLAGSERAKRTGAVGTTLKEGISINKGLLCLGNVISALTDENKKTSYIPYRDSKLTRILQDSLGGNSNTFMIACISPAGINFEETLNTLKYASRARHIKNKPVVNTDSHSAMIASLKLEIFNLKQEILNYHNIIANSTDGDLRASLELIKKSAIRNENNSDLDEHKNLQQEKRITMLNSELENLRTNFQALEIENLKIKQERDVFKLQIERYIDLLRIHGIPMLQEDETSVKLVDEYLEIIEKLKKEKENKDMIIKDLEIEYSNLMKEMERDRKLLNLKVQEIEKLKSSKMNNKSEGNFEDLLLKKTEDYGRAFAETVFARLEKPENPDETIDSISTEIGEDFSVKESELEGQHEEIVMVESKIKEKEEKLKDIEDVFKSMQAKLLDEMSKQYYKKIEDIELEMRKTEKERDLALEKIKGKPGSEQKTIDDKYRAKIQTLEQQLQENLKKNRELNNLHKLVEDQKSKLAKLDEDVKKEKKQKVEMQKKLKEEKDNLSKLKSQRQKEILIMKKLGEKKDQEIKILKSENRKKEIFVKRKTEEMAAIQKRVRDTALKRKGPLALSIETLKEWVQDYSNACVEEKEFSKLLAIEMKEKEELEEDLKDLYASLSEMRLKLEKNELILEDHEPGVDLDELYEKIQIGRSETQETSELIEIIEEKVRFKEIKILEYSSKIDNSLAEEIKYKGVNIASPENTQNLLMVLFDEILNKSCEIKNLSKMIQLKEVDIEELNQALNNSQLEKDLMKKNFERDLHILQVDLQEKKNYILRIIEESEKNQQDLGENIEKTEENRRLKERLEEYMTKYSKLLKAYNEKKEGECDNTKPRFSINTSFTNKRDQLKKKKYLLEEEADEKEKLSAPRISLNLPSGKNSNSQKNIIVEDELAHERLHRSTLTKSRTSIQPEYCLKPYQKWIQEKSVEDHDGPIFSMFSTENMLYIGSNEILKVWSLEKLAYVSEIKAHTSFIKSMVYWPERQSLFTSCGNMVNSYETSVLRQSFSFKGHTDEIRVMKIHNDKLYCAGKSNPNSLTIWDLRNLVAPVEEKEKTLDIFSLLITENTIFYGCRDHKVHRMRLSDHEVLKPCESLHYGAVTSLALFGDVLVSGSRDNHLKIWETENDKELKTILNAHTDWVNCICTDPLQRNLYSGGKEGKVRVWGGIEINHTGEISGHSGSVNCISALSSNQQIIITGSSDRTFKVWRLDEDSNSP